MLMPTASSNETKRDERRQNVQPNPRMPSHESKAQSRNTAQIYKDAGLE